MTAGFEFILRGGTEAAWGARRAIAENYPTLPDSLLEDLSLLVTELVTNAVRHGGATADGAIKIEIQRRADCIRAATGTGTCRAGSSGYPGSARRAMSLRRPRNRLPPTPRRSRGPRQHLSLIHI